MCFILCGYAPAQAQDMDKELSKLADKLAVLIKDNGKKKVTVLDFTDLQGGGSELGKYIAEELTVNLVMGKRDFSVLDRANLRKILAEHKLTATGLVDPENAKKLGQFAGVDALIMGTIIPKGTNAIGLTAKIITTDTAEIVGATRAEFKSDDTVQKLVFQPAAVGAPSEKAQVVKSYGDLGVELHSLGIANAQDYVLDVVLKNQNAKRSIWVALSPRPDRTSRTLLVDSERFEFQTRDNYVSGIQCDELQYDMFFRATEIKPGDSVPVSIKFYSWSNRPASAGLCTIHLGILLGHSMNGNQGGKATAHNLVAKVEAK
jgi:hypothetical protein